MKAKIKQKVATPNEMQFKDVLKTLFQKPSQDEPITTEMLKSFVSVNEITLNLFPETWKESHVNRKKIIDDFFNTNKKNIHEYLFTNETLKDSSKKLFVVYGENCELFNKIITINVISIYNLLKQFFSIELNSLLTISELLVDKKNHKQIIRGFLVDYYLNTKIFSINWKVLEQFINNMFLNSYVNIFFLEDNHREWLKGISVLAKDFRELRIKNPEHNSISKKEKPKKNIPGPLPKFRTEKDLHEAIKKIKDWKLLSISQVSLKLGFKSQNRLGQIYSEKNWTHPKNNNSNPQN